jgi:hypothetical protein
VVLSLKLLSEKNVLHRFCRYGDSVYKMVTVSCACSVTV